MMRKRVLLAFAGILLTEAAGAQDLRFPFAEGFAATQPGDPEYQKGLSELDAQQWDKAVATFSAAAMKKKPGVADASLYWKAYAENKLGQTDKALASLAVLKKAYPSSRWVTDAKELALEVNLQSLRPVNPSSTDLVDLRILDEQMKAMASQLDRASRTMSPAGGTGDPDQDLKLIAVNSLMQSDPATALPILQKVLASSNNSQKIKERALFVLTQNRSAEARKILLDTAHNASNDGLQMKAIDFLGMMGGDDTQKDLASLYTRSSDPKVKKEVLKSYMLSGSSASLLAAARTEKDPALRSQAIKYLAMTGKSDNADALTAIYKSDSNAEVRKAVLDALFMMQDGKTMVELANAEKDPAQKLEIVRKMSMIQSPETKTYMLEILK